MSSRTQITSGTDSERCISIPQVLTVAVNSGLVTYPTSYKKLGYAPGLTIWEPVPPEHYVYLGHVTTAGEDEPSVKEVTLLLLRKSLAHLPVMLVISFCLWLRRPLYMVSTYGATPGRTV